MRQVKRRAQEVRDKKRETASWRRGGTLNGGKKRSEGNRGERRKGKGKLPPGEMERLQLHQPEAHAGPLVALLRPSTAGANGVKPQHKLLILKSSALGAVGAQCSTGSGSLLIMCSYRQCFQCAFYRLTVHSEDLIQRQLALVSFVHANKCFQAQS